MEMTFLPTSTPTFWITPHDVPQGLGSVRPHGAEVRSPKDVDVEGVILQHEGVVDENSRIFLRSRDASACGGRPAPWSLPCGGPLGQTPQMRLVIWGMSSAGRPMLGLEAPQFGNLKIGAFVHLALGVQGSLDRPWLQAGDRIEV